MSIALCSGCGLGDYEKKLDEQYQREKHDEEENSNLEPRLLRLPEKPDAKDAKKPEDKEAVSNEQFFFRPPKGVSTQPEAKPIGRWSRYPALADSGFSEVLVAVRKLEGKEKERFQKEALTDLRLRVETPRPRDIPRFGGTPIHFMYLQEDAQGISTRVFFHSMGAFEAAIAFRIPLSSNVNANLAETRIPMSLATLVIGDTASYQQRKFNPPPPPAPKKR